jgi:hypothetical protein
MRDKHLFDTSEYDQEHLLYSTENKKVLGKMNDETHGIAIQEFEGLVVVKVVHECLRHI